MRKGAEEEGKEGRGEGEKSRRRSDKRSGRDEEVSDISRK